MPEEQKRNNAAESRVWGVISQLGLNKVLPLASGLQLLQSDVTIRCSVCCAVCLDASWYCSLHGNIEECRPSADAAQLISNSMQTTADIPQSVVDCIQTVHKV